MPSAVDICNLALIALGQDLILSLTEQSTPAQRCAVLLPQRLDAMLRDFDWSFAECKAEIAADGVPPAFGYLYRYALPTDPYCLRVRKIQDEGGTDTYPYRLVGRHIETDLPAPLYLTYTCRPSDYAKLDAMFVDALAAGLAMDLARALTGDQDERANLAKEFTYKVTIARDADATEANQPIPWKDPWIEARGGQGLEDES